MIASPGQVLEKCRAALRRATYPPLVHPSVHCDQRVGAVQIGEGVVICAGTTLTTEVVVGAGATVVKDITVPDTYVGTPARLLVR